MPSRLSQRVGSSTTAIRSCLARWPLTSWTHAKRRISWALPAAPPTSDALKAQQEARYRAKSLFDTSSLARAAVRYRAFSSHLVNASRTPFSACSRPASLSRTFASRHSRMPACEFALHSSRTLLASGASFGMAWPANERASRENTRAFFNVGMPPPFLCARCERIFELLRIRGIASTVVPLSHGGGRDGQGITDFIASSS